MTTNVAVVPGHPRLSFRLIHEHDKHGRSNTEMRASIHTGTHCDPPYHFVPGGKTIDRMPLDRFMGKAVRIDLRRKALTRHNPNTNRGPGCPDIKIRLVPEADFLEIRNVAIGGGPELVGSKFTVLSPTAGEKGVRKFVRR